MGSEFRKVMRDIDSYVKRYDSWYERHVPVYRSELLALERLIPKEGLGLEVGVGTGRFAGPLGIKVGLDPSLPYLRLAKERGVEVVRGVGEELPFKDEAFDFVALILVLAFAKEPRKFIREARRVLKRGGHLIVSIVPADSPWGRYYRERGKRGHPIFRHVRLLKVSELENVLREEGFEVQEWVSTLYTPPLEKERVEKPIVGRKDGSFVCVKAAKPSR